MNTVHAPTDAVATIPVLDQPERFAGACSLTDALVNAYYQRDIDAIRRIAAQAEYRLYVLAHTTPPGAA